MKKMKKRLCALLATLLLLTGITPAAMAEDNSAVLSEDVVQEIAGLFINDMVNSGLETTWTTTTEVVSSTPLYDENGSITAYSFDLADENTEKGYVVVAVYPDMENEILEFSDTAKPLYEEFSLAPTDKIVYTGNLKYFKDTGTNMVTTLEKITTPKASLNSSVKEARSREFMPSTTRSISNPITWANENYAGPFKAYEWRNNFEDYCEFYAFTDFKIKPSGNGKPYYMDTCVPVAIVNLLKMRGAKDGFSNITELYKDDLFKYVLLDIGHENYFYNASTESCYTDAIDEYVEMSFEHYIPGSWYYSKNPATYDKIKSEINMQRPFLLNIVGSHSDYANHAVAGYAYTRLKSESTGYYKSFLKVADGLVHSGRYIDIATIQSGAATMHCIGY